MEFKFTNDLIKETSPYLLQHAHNPVNWLPWSKNVFEKAKKENKLVLISVGYAACHWCHVMEKECFEDEEVATWMNRHLISVKVDREERPDVDMLYMNAVQLMQKQGGWPLNCFTLPDGRPIFGGTYFPKNQFINIIKNLVDVYENEHTKTEEYAVKLFSALNYENKDFGENENKSFLFEDFEKALENWSSMFDFEEGGLVRAPKFPMPVNYCFLLNYAIQTKHEELENYVQLTLNKMALGGVFDHLAGGFYRYSVDAHWKIPHFEKMLYDNGQLLGLYAEAFQRSNSPIYEQTIYKTFSWLIKEMKGENGLFFAAIDADSEGVEGKYYRWTKEEWKNIFTVTDYQIFKENFYVNDKALWEEDFFVLVKKSDKKTKELVEIEHKLLALRLNRIKPAIDHKALTSWNALLISGLIKAYEVTKDLVFKKEAINLFNNLIEKQFQNKILYRNNVNGHTTIEGFLEDYAQLIKACIDIHQSTLEDHYLSKAEELTELCLAKFYDETKNIFYFTENNSELIIRQEELHDNVIPASSSTMYHNLYLLSLLLPEKYYQFEEKILLKLNHLKSQIITYSSSYANWLNLSFLIFSKPKVISFSNDKSILEKELIKQKVKEMFFYKRDKFLSNAYVICQGKTCSKPINDFNALIDELNL